MSDALPTGRRNVLAVIGLAAVVVAALVAYVFAFLAPEEPVPQNAPPSAPAEPSAEAVPPEPADPVAQHQLAASRDPFEQLAVVPEQPAPGSSPAPSGAAPGEAEGGPRSLDLPAPTERTADGEDGGVDQSPPPGAPPPMAAVPADVELRRITVDEAGIAHAEVVIAGQRYAAAEGEQFGDGYHLAVLDPPCVQIARGEARQRVCEEDKVVPK